MRAGTNRKPAPALRADFPHLRVLNKTQPLRYAVELRHDSAAILLALLQFDCGAPEDIVHAALNAVWLALKRSPPPRQRIKARRVRGGAIVTLENLLPDAGKKITAKLKPETETNKGS